MGKRQLMKIACFARPPKFWTRMVMMLIGVLVQGFGLSLLIQIDLGTDPWTCFVMGISNRIPLTYGTWQLICAAVLFVFVVIFDLGKIGFGTIGNMVCVGYIADFFGFIWSKVFPAGFFDSPLVCWLLLLPVLAVFISGASAYLCADLGGSPYDVLPFIISARLPRVPFKVIRIAWDTAFLVLGFAIGGTVGIVTILIAFFLGPAISWFKARLAVFLR